MEKKSDPPSGFSRPRTRGGMRHPRPSKLDELARPPSGSSERTLGPSTAAPRERTIDDLYAEHWPYVRMLLLGCGVDGQDVGDVAQTVWMHVHRRRDSYDAPTHKTPRAWVTGFVVRCAANHRRTQRRRELVLMEDPGGVLAAQGLDAEQVTILRDLHRLIPNEEQRVALLLQVRHGFTIAEIAAVQEVTESAVEWRLSMARKSLRNGDEKKAKSGAYLGFGSLEALAEALKPRPIPDEVGRRDWERIAERIRQEEASPGDPETEPPPEGPFPSDLPPAVALPALASPTLPALVTLGKVKLAALVFLSFMSGAGAGVGCIAAWRAHETGRYTHATPAMDAAPVASAKAVPSSTPAARSTGARAAAPSSTPAAPSTSTRAAAPSSTPATRAATLDEGESRRVLSRMRDSMIAQQFSRVLTLADQHARQFRTTHIREREALRIEALRETGRTNDAEQRARAVIATHPEHRGAMERAAGRALP